MKVKVTERAFYNLEYLKEGQIIDFKGKVLPSWATLADGIETQKGSTNKTNKKQSAPEAAQVSENIQETSTETNENIDEVQNETNTEAEGENAENENGLSTAQEQSVPDNSTLSDNEKQEYLDLLINEGIEKGIFVEDADKKTVNEQIKELEAALNK